MKLWLRKYKIGYQREIIQYVKLIKWKIILQPTTTRVYWRYGIPWDRAGFRNKFVLSTFLTNF